VSWAPGPPPPAWSVSLYINTQVWSRQLWRKSFSLSCPSGKKYDYQQKGYRVRYTVKCLLPVIISCSLEYHSSVTIAAVGNSWHDTILNEFSWLSYAVVSCALLHATCCNFCAITCRLSNAMETIHAAKIMLQPRIFSVTLEACDDYCTKKNCSTLHVINCTWNHGIKV